LQIHPFSVINSRSYIPHSTFLCIFIHLLLSRAKLYSSVQSSSTQSLVNTNPYLVARSPLVLIAQRLHNDETPKNIQIGFFVSSHQPFRSFSFGCYTMWDMVTFRHVDHTPTSRRLRAFRSSHTVSVLLVRGVHAEGLWHIFSPHFFPSVRSFFFSHSLSLFFLQRYSW